MVRRRMASPKPSAPVRSTSSYRTSPSPPTQRSYAPTRAATTTTLPAKAPAMAAANPAPTASGPGLMGQMAATAGGVAIGSAVGHAVGNMFTSGSSGSQEVAAQAAPAPQEGETDFDHYAPCKFEWKQFIDCTKYQNDLSLCEKLNEELKACRARFG